MKKVILFAGVLAVAYFFFVSSSEKKAGAKIQLAESLAAEGRFDEAFHELDSVEEWFGWTEASERAPEVRAAVEKKQRVHTAKTRQWREEDYESLDEMEREQKAAEDRQEDTKRRVEEARKRARLLSGGG